MPIIILLIILVLFLIFLIFYEPNVKTNFVENMTVEKTEDLFFVYETVMYPSNVQIIRLKNKSNITVGITGDPWNINFGLIPIGVESRRFVNLANYKNENYKVKINVYGNISPMISFDKNNFIMHKGDELKLTVLLNSTVSAKTGNFTGEIDIISKSVKFQFLEVFL